MRFRCWKYGSRTCEKRRTCFLTCAGVICSIKRKRWYYAISELISHLNLALRCTSTSDRKASPKTLPPGQGNSMAWRAQRLVFWPVLRRLPMSKRCAKKLYTIWARFWRFPCNFPTTRTRNHDFEATGKQQGLTGSPSLFSVQNAPLQTRKQHGLASSTDPFLTYMSPHPDAKL